MEIAVNRLAILCFFVVGISHIFQPRAWVRFFSSLHSKGEIGSLLNAFLPLRHDLSEQTNLPMLVIHVTFLSGIPHKTLDKRNAAELESTR